MRSEVLRIEKMNSRPGFLFLGILVAAVGVMILIVVLYTGSYNPFALFEGSEATRYSDPNAYPWDEYRLFIKKQLDGYGMGGRRPPFRTQPTIKSRLTYKGSVYNGDKQLGEIELVILKDGDAFAGWTGEFNLGNKKYRLDPGNRKDDLQGANGFTGNIAPLKIYEDKNGKDRSKLYVITAGSFRLQGPYEENVLTGGAYVTAWIDKKYKLQGKLSMPSFIDGKLAVL